MEEKPAFRSVAYLLLCNMGIPVCYSCLPSTVTSFIQLHHHNNNNNNNGTHTTSMRSATDSRLTKSSLSN